MENMTAQQLSDLALQLKTMARSISDYQTQHWNDAKPQELADLNKKERDLLHESQDLIAQSVVVSVNDAAATLQSITNLADRMKKELHQINEINHVIRIATACVSLATAIAGNNATAIVGAIKGISDAF